jgi:hypothetical protein
MIDRQPDFETGLAGMRFEFNFAAMAVTVPEPTPFVVKKGSNIRDWTSAGIPGPSSTISTTM